MKSIYSIIIIALFNISCMAQTVSLETMAQCSNNPETCPNATYVKDVNNLLNKYVGTWIGTLNGKNYEFNFAKKENTGEVIKWDFLVGRLKITNSNGIIEFDNFNKTDAELEKRFGGHNFQSDLKVYIMQFFGGKLNCIDYGYSYLRIKPETPNSMSILFLPSNDIVTEDCSNFLTTLPSEKLIYLTRQ
ncbi:DUF6705 family protein [Chryseobacterium sp. M5]|uniref:DUF6705 family protein n=1 Tax=Chryseobacterium sp. M5 TaxID=3379128 RepID=UPI003857E726